ncbi:MAG: twin-arginine translocase TatA/TatE family subunit [Anaerolineales bacterium]|jgi:sec-independent protein translocase protein TatA|nr:twin-arginine translocase TatA/TatE family subunit [Anaerolineales bacterium]
MNFGPTELIIILVIVIVLFGVGRISKIAGEMGSGIRAFKEGLRGDDEDKDEKAETKSGEPTEKS